MPTRQGNDDPTATYRGYRRQSLYVLARLFDDGLSDDVVIQPEGFEDVAIRKANEEVVEVVQVKDHSDNLTVSSLGEPFFKRVPTYLRADPQPLLKVVSFGAIGPELSNAKAGAESALKPVLQTLTKLRERKRNDGQETKPKEFYSWLTTTEAERFIKDVVIESVTENDLTNRIVKTLAASVAGVSPQDAFEFLMWWMITSAETQRRIRRQDAIAKLSHIGKFIEGRRAFDSDWSKSIVPLVEGSKVETPESRQRLKDDFYRGGRVGFDHILADVDVVREEVLSKILKAFRVNNVVVIHSASGQGKTTLALRYLKEFVPSAMRLQLKSPEGPQHARRMGLAIREQAQALGLPTIVYVDVRPGETDWHELVRELSDAREIQVLVTIREEDWQRTRDLMSDVLCSEIDIEFEEDEARRIYEAIQAKQPSSQHLDFSDAWNQFGEQKRLLEFVYYITQSETLTQRIRAQVRSFQEEVRRNEASPMEEKLLRLVAVASSYESRLDLKAVIAKCGLTSPQATLRRFEDEYFVRTSRDGRLLDGFHAIRSEVLAESLTDAVLCPWSETAAETLPLMIESDLESFLLCVFSRRWEATEVITSALNSLLPRTWEGLCGVMRALMWLGIREYWDANRDVVREAQKQGAAGWSFLLDFDVARIRGENGRSVIEELGESWRSAAEGSREIREKQSDKQQVFDRVRTWLLSIKTHPLKPVTTSDWSALAEVMFWCGHIKIDSRVLDVLNESLISSGTECLQIDQVGPFVRGVRTANAALYDGWLTKHRDAFLERVRREAAIIKLNETEQGIVAHYVIDLDSKASRLRRPDQSKVEIAASLHELTIERVDLLADLIGGKATYGAVGYGHRSSLSDGVIDEANKPGVLAESLLPSWGPRLNGISIGYCDYGVRCGNWDEYFARLSTLRGHFVECLENLSETLRMLPEYPDATSLIESPECWDQTRAEFFANISFPKSAVDEWGYYREAASDGQMQLARSISRSTAIDLVEMRKALSEFTSKGRNFLNQAWQALLLRYYKNNLPTAERKRLFLAHVKKTMGVDEHGVRLSVINGCDVISALTALHRVFERSSRLQRWRDIELEQRELNAATNTINAWAAYCYPPKNRRVEVDNAAFAPFGWVLNPLRDRLQNKLNKIGKRLPGKPQIDVRVHRETLQWDLKPGLWIIVNAAHPVSVSSALEVVWDRIQEAFDASGDDPLKSCVTMLYWEEIVVTLTINGRNYDGSAYRRFKHATYDKRRLTQCIWAMESSTVPSWIWDQLGVECLTAPREMQAMNEFADAYSAVLIHVQHMADLKRVDTMDELGIEIIESYLRREGDRFEPLLVALYDSISKVFEVAESMGELVANSNLTCAIQALVALQDHIAPPTTIIEQPDPEKPRGFDLDAAVAWRDRLISGAPYMGTAKLFWLAHLIDAPPFEGLE